MRIRPASSTISASITPGEFLKKSKSARRLITAFTASRLQPGHTERVLRGTPAATGIRSLLLSNGPGAQRGFDILPCGKAELIRLEKVQAAFDAAFMTRAVTADMGRVTSGVRFTAMVGTDSNCDSMAVTTREARLRILHRMSTCLAQLRSFLWLAEV